MPTYPLENKVELKDLLPSEQKQIWSANETLELFKTLSPIETLNMLNQLAITTLDQEKADSFDPDWGPLNMEFWALNITLLPQNETNLKEYWSSFLKLAYKTLSPLDTSLSPTQKRIFGTIRDTIIFTLKNMSERGFQIRMEDINPEDIGRIWNLKTRTPEEILNLLKP